MAGKEVKEKPAKEAKEAKEKDKIKTKKGQDARTTKVKAGLWWIVTFPPGASRGQVDEYEPGDTFIQINSIEQFHSASFLIMYIIVIN